MASQLGSKKSLGECFGRDEGGDCGRGGRAEVDGVGSGKGSAAVTGVASDVDGAGGGIDRS